MNDNNIYNNLAHDDEILEPRDGDNNVTEIEKSEIQDNKTNIFTLNVKWSKDLESDEGSDGEEENEDDWYHPPTLNLNSTEEQHLSTLDSVSGITYRGQTFTNSIHKSNPLWPQLDEWNRCALRKQNNIQANTMGNQEPAQDGYDNLTYREDSLSVIRGRVSTRLGRDLPLWILTDSGAMTQLIQREYAQKMKFKIENIPTSQQFNIRGPGGGKGQVTQQVSIMVSFDATPISGDDQAGNDEIEDTQQIGIKMTFGIVDELPVPILWGGKQMRLLECHDLHERKLLTFKWREDQRYSMPTTSWLAACQQIMECGDARITKTLKHLLPSKERMVNMATGTRQTTNVGAALYPGRGNIVRVARHQARVDEGTNQVEVLNTAEIEEEYGRLITCTDCVNHGEAFLVVYNNTERALYSPGGKLKLSVTPVINLPICSTASSEFQQLKAQHLANHEETTDLPRPRTFVTWSCDDLSARITSGDLNTFYKETKEYMPDVIAIQQIKWAAHPQDHTRVLPGSADEENFDLLSSALAKHYHIHLNLCSKRYGGQMVLVSVKCQQPDKITYSLEAEGSTRVGSGRVTKLQYPTFDIWSIWAPTLGKKDPRRMERRKHWDKILCDTLGQDSQRHRIVLGNFQTVLADHHMSGTTRFWHKQGEDVNQLGIPDDTQDMGDVGFPGTTANERMRFHEGLSAAHLVDSQHTRPRHKTQFTWKRPKSPHKLVTTYTFVSSDIYKAGGVEANTTIEPVNTSDPYLGSEHRPKWLSLKPNWETKVKEMERSGSGLEEIEEEINEEEKEINMVILNTMFRNMDERLTPKSRLYESDELRIIQPKKERDEDIGPEEKPDEFPVELWELVEPNQRKKVAGRFGKFVNKEYLNECIQKVLNDLDIMERKEEEVCWQSNKIKAKDGKVMRAQALANIDAYFFPDPKVAELARDVVAEINTTDEKPMRCRPRKLLVVQQAFLQAKTNIMVRQGKLEESQGQWSHGLVLVAYEDRIKKFMDEHGDEATEKMFKPEFENEVATFFRLCIDLRMLNNKTIPDIYPLPRIDDLVESIPRTCGRFSISDICDAFFTCELKKEHRPKTAFKTHGRHLQFAVLPQGFINSPSIFCRLIARTFKGIERDKFSAYIDDVLNHTEEFEEHLSVQQEVYNRLRENRLTLKLAKTHLNQNKIKFLGHIMVKGGRYPDPKAVEAILEWRDPTTAKEVRQFLGSTLYYREYIMNYSDMAMPLYDLIKKGVIVESEWKDDVHGEAVKKLKEALATKPVLMSIDPNRPFRLKIDACRKGRGIGCILEQSDEEGNGTLCPITLHH